MIDIVFFFTQLSLSGVRYGWGLPAPASADLTTNPANIRSWVLCTKIWYAKEPNPLKLTSYAHLCTYTRNPVHQSSKSSYPLIFKRILYEIQYTWVDLGIDDSEYWSLNKPYLPYELNADKPTSLMWRSKAFMKSIFFMVSTNQRIKKKLYKLRVKMR